MPFDIRQLRFVIAAADHTSFHRAAVTLGVEQSTLSRSIQKLERVMGVALFRRSRSGVVATTAGATFVSDARQIVIFADQLTLVMRTASQGRTGSLKVGNYSPASAGNLRLAMRAWSDNNPDVEIVSVEAKRAYLLAKLDSGIIDIAFLPGDAEYTGVQKAGLWSERVFAALPASHSLATFDHVDWLQLRSETFLLPSEDPGPEIRDMLIARLSVWGIHLDIKMRDVSRETIMSGLGSGAGITVTCDGSAGTHYPDVILKEIHGRHGVSLVSYSGYWKGETENPALKRFLAFIRNRYVLNDKVP